MNIYNVTPDNIRNNIITLHNLVFEVTDSCNLKCEYCVYSDIYEGFDHRKGQKLPFKKAKLILDYLIKVWSENKRYVSYKDLFLGFYGGEPLLNIELIKKIIDYVDLNCKGIRRKIIYTMTTNALLLDTYMDYLVEKDVHLLISLDGAKTGNSYRRTPNNKDSFEKVFTNVLNLKEKYPSYFESNINFNSVITNRNSLDDIYEFFSTHLNKIPRIAEINCNNVKDNCRKKFTSMYQNKYESIIKSVDKQKINDELFISSPEVGSLTNFIFHHTGNTFYSYNDLLIDREQAKIVPTSTCVPFHKKMFITVNGKIMQCEKISHKYSLGEIKEESIVFDYTKIAKDFNAYVNSVVAQCDHCYMNTTCSTCVFQMNAQNFNNSEKSSVIPCFYSKQKYNKYIETNMRFLKENPFMYEKILKQVKLK